MKSYMLLIGTVGSVFFLCSCHSSTRSSVVTSNKPYALSTVNGCNELESLIRTSALTKMNQIIDKNLEIALKRSYESCSMAEGSVNGYSPSPNTSTNDGATQASGTNNQVVGVDEADFVKNTNKYIYLVSGNNFRIFDAWPAPAMKEIAKVAIEGTPTKLFVHENRALIYSSLPLPTNSASEQTYGRYGYENSECTYGYNCMFTGDGHPTKLTIFDISQPQKPQLVRELKLSGSYLNSRRIGKTVHTVISSPGVNFGGVEYWPQEITMCGDSHKSDLEIQSAFEAIRSKNSNIIQTSPLTDWLPSISDTTYGLIGPVTSANLLLSCDNFYRANMDDGSNLTTVLSLDITQEKAPGISTIISQPGAVFASENSLYLSVPYEKGTNGNWYPSMDAENQASTVHKFALDNENANTIYSGSGLVKGRVLNQFSMDEWQGDLRMATTSGHVPDEKVHSTLTILRQSGTELLPIGLVDHLAPKEDIRSVRFDGNRGFIVTFKKTDPLFVLNLEDPQHPTVESELKIPGFSTYMHLMDAGHLLTIGYDANDHDDFAYFSGVMLQIFDVRDMKAPALVHKEIIGTRGSSSEALTNHLAFNFFAPQELLALPMTVCEGGGDGIYGQNMTFSGLMVYKVNTQNGFKLQGKVSHVTTGENWCSNWWSNASSVVKRSIIMDDYVFSITGKQIKVNHLNNLASDITAVSIE